MARSDFERDSVGLRERGKSEDGEPANLALVLVAGNSQVNRIVVSRIVERADLKVIADAPDEAAEYLERLRPGTVILDGGADNRECDMLLDRIAGHRRGLGSDLPRVLLITTTNGTPEALAPGKLVDAIVAKPITPETLQPVVMRLVEDGRD